MQLPKPTSGSMFLRGRDMTSLKGRELRRARAEIQMIFQDPIGSLNPLRRLRDIVAEGLQIEGALSRGEIAERVRDIIEAVGLDPEVVGARRPHEFSGGQCQRIGIARAVVVNPLILLCDEPVSSLDVSVQAQIINLLHEMKRRYGLTVLFIAHDLAVVKATERPGRRLVPGQDLRDRRVERHLRAAHVTLTRELSSMRRPRSNTRRRRANLSWAGTCPRRCRRPRVAAFAHTLPTG